MTATDPVSFPAPGAGADRLIAAAARAADGARARLGGAINDLFRPPENRLSDREHALMTRMLAGMVADIERRLCDAMATEGGLGDGLEDELADPARPIVLPRLARSRMLRDPDLAGLLLRRCDEHHLACRLQQAGPGLGGALDRLSLHSDPAVRDGVAVLLIEGSRRVDGFGEPRARIVDMPLRLLHRLGWWVSALLRDYLVDRALDPAIADRALAMAVLRLVEDHDPSGTIDRHAERLAILLQREDALDEPLLADLLRDGQVALWVACLGVRSGVPASMVWTMLADPEASRLTLLMRASGLGRAAALGMLADLFIARDGARAENDLRLTEAATGFDALDPETAAAAIRPYREAGHHD